MKITIGIVGGGPAGVSLCVQLQEKLAQNRLQDKVEILVFEKSEHIGHGLPYRGQNDCYILNLPTDVMDPNPCELGSFTRWCKGLEVTVEDEKFPPRYLFGRYLEEKAIDLQLRSSQIQLFPQHEVMDIEEMEGLFRVVTNRGDFECDSLILSLGHMPTSQFKELSGLPGYIHNPWKEDSFQSINAHQDVHIIGTRLTAIDIALKLVQKGHLGQIYMSSRSGLLPTVLGKTVDPYELKYLTKERVFSLSAKRTLELRDLCELFMKEFEEQTDIRTFPKNAKEITALTWILNEIQEAERGNRLWQRILFSLYPLTPLIWSRLSDNARSEFMNHYNSLFLTYLAAFPLSNAYKIKRLLESKQLIVSGGLRKVKSNHKGFVLTFDDQFEMNANCVINGTGMGSNPREIPLLRRLIDRNIIVPHPHGGIVLDRETLQVKRANGNRIENMYAIGEITKGEKFFTADYGCITAQAHSVITHLLSSNSIDSIMSSVGSKRRTGLPSSSR